MNENACKEVFEKYKIKFTRQRCLIYCILSGMSTPVTVEDIFLKSRELDATINLSTAYRIINMFAGKNIVHITGTADKKSLYELDRHEHKHHLICLKCRKTQVLAQCPFDNYEKALSQTSDFKITGHQLSIYGYCSECQSGNTPEPKDN